jgi:D-alanyl-lipoteichoic acid acyltransferase DltB (MBOAT superfamily)
MSFISPIFLIFLPVVFGLYYCIPRRQWQNSVSLLASYFFYGWWDYRFCALMLFASLLDYAIGWQIARARTPRVRRMLLAGTLLSNLGMLGFFKYFNFFVDSFALWASAVGFDVGTTTLNIILPLGISFYTFQTLSYTIDIYRGTFQPRTDLIEYLAFVSFFPQLVAGPIERAADLLPQFSKVRRFSQEDAVEGSRLMLWGFTKKMVFADNLGSIADGIFNRVGSATGADLAIGTLAFAFQIYCDFSGYSDIAAGTANLFGIRLRRNFAYPYFSRSCAEFWRRWHITLSQWFRDYIYIPLGGSRGTRRETVRNVMATMLLSGLWHGAAWHFVAWGMLQGLYLAADPFHRPSGPGGAISQLPGGQKIIPSAKTIVQMSRTFILMCAGWILFRASSLGEALEIYGTIAKGFLHSSFYAGLWDFANEHGLGIFGLGAFIIIEWLGRFSWNPLSVAEWPRFARWTAYSVIFWAAVYFGTRRTAEFIYFQF